jgi:sodium/pantothenate symporter
LTLEQGLVVLYLAACIAIGLLASRRVLTSREEYWVAGRRIGTSVNALAIMATLASGGSIIGVMGLAYAQGIPSTLALFAGAVVGFPLASVLVARPLRRFGKYTITDFLAFRYPHRLVRILVPVLIIASFTVYIVAQMKAAGITANALLGIPYDTAVTAAAVVFILYVSLGGMTAITWTDVIQGVLMLLLVLGTSAVVIWRAGSPAALLADATAVAPELGKVADQSTTTYVGYFVIWAAAIPVVPHIVMRVFTARDAQSARLSLNLAMVGYSVMILAAVMAIVPMGKVAFPELRDADQVFLEVMKSEFSPLIRGVAVAAVLAAVMSTTDALLLACSSAVSHDLLGGTVERRLGASAGSWLRVGTVWMIGGLALYWAYSPPQLLTKFYTAAIGLLSAALFVPTVAGLWWRRANLAGGIASLSTGTATYALLELDVVAVSVSPILVALPASVLAMWIGSRFGTEDSRTLLERIQSLHDSADEES